MPPCSRKQPGRSGGVNLNQVTGQGWANNSPLDNQMDLSRKLYKEEMQELAQIIAVVSERAFRRGYQQGIFAHDNERQIIEPYVLRYSLPDNWSPNPETGFGGMPALNRLYIEENDLLREMAGLSFTPDFDIIEVENGL